MKNVVDVFYNDIIENSKCSESITEYMLNKNIEGFNELLNNSSKSRYGTSIFLQVK